MKADREARITARTLNDFKQVINMTPLGGGGDKGNGAGALAAAAAGGGE